ncbi:hypothetical protein ABL841_28675 [Variovorax paradoxus]|uniref:hypothetical protein n=1 Tax=Variovorax paradoxus TaxID=34073 RepID=UPI00035E0F52|nr:hypothetical protein [Variovorax paradoxus]
MAYQLIFSMASAFERTGRFVRSFHSSAARSDGASRLSVNDRQIEHRILLLLADRRAHSDAAVPDLEKCLAALTLRIPELDAMQSLHSDISHFISDRVIAIAGKTINASSDEESHAQFRRGAEQLVDVPFPVTDAHTALGLSKKGCRLPKIFQPSEALLLLDWYTSGIDLPLQRIGALELLAIPELDRA